MDTGTSLTDDLDSGFYWRGLDRGVLLLQRCDDCLRPRFPPLPSCPYCGSRRQVIIESEGRGRLYSWVTVHRALSPVFAADVPYTVAVVELDEGCRVLSRMSHPAGLVADVPLQLMVDRSTDPAHLRAVIAEEGAPTA